MPGIGLMPIAERLFSRRRTSDTVCRMTPVAQTQLNVQQSTAESFGKSVANTRALGAIQDGSLTSIPMTAKSEK